MGTIEYKPVLICKNCNKSIDKVKDKIIFQICGNVMATSIQGGFGGIIGGNIAKGPKETWEPKQPSWSGRDLVYKSKNLRIYSMSYCKDCLIEVIKRVK